MKLSGNQINLPLSGNVVPAASVRRAVSSSYLGTAIEWYDFFIFSTAAALVFGETFFPAADPTARTLLSFATLGIGFLARPLGGAVAGHLGDRIGRKATLILTLSVMGFSTAAIGVLPSYDQVGLLAPVLLVLLRLLQGFSAGGEWAGAALMAVEHAPERTRARWGSVVQSGTPTGLILATLVFLGVQLAVGSDAFVSWGWRIPFLVSVVLLGVAMYIRLKVSESPVFTTMRAQAQVAEAPLLAVFRLHRRSLLVAALTFVGCNAIGYVFLSFLLAYGTGTLGLGRGVMLMLSLIGAVVWCIANLTGGALADRIGRRRTYLIGYVVFIGWAFPFFVLIDTRVVGLMVVATVVLCVAIGLTFGPQCALFAELFPPGVRYSGASLATALGSIAGGAFAPLIATALFARTSTVYAVSAYMTVVAVVSFGAVLLIREPDLTRMRAGDYHHQPQDPAEGEPRR